jgi:hypothetical protein
MNGTMKKLKIAKRTTVEGNKSTDLKPRKSKGLKLRTRIRAGSMR